MRLPRDVDGEQLVKALKQFGYAPTRQTDSHVRLSTQEHGEHHVTLPMHKPIRVGTLAAILSDVATHLTMSREELLRKLFG